MESITPIFIAQLKGKKTKQCYHTATIFLDHYSGLAYVHLQIIFPSDKTLQSNKAFKAYVQTYKVKIKH